MPCAETSSLSFGRALSDVGNARLMTTSKPACRSAAKSSGCGMPLVASRRAIPRAIADVGSTRSWRESLLNAAPGQHPRPVESNQSALSWFLQRCPCSFIFA
jgi:hypothetical protein